MAEGLARLIFNDSVTVNSAGSNPGQVNPIAIKVMKEIGINILTQKSKKVTDITPLFLSKINYVITLCEEEVCPTIISTGLKIHWPLPDPAGKGGNEEIELIRFRKTRDELSAKIRSFARENGFLDSKYK